MSSNKSDSPKELCKKVIVKSHFLLLLIRESSFGKLIKLAALILICVNCRGKQDEIEGLFTHSVNARSIQVKYNEGRIGEPMSTIFVEKGRLVLLDYNSDSFVTVINLENPDSVWYFGKKGRGPGEIVHATSLSMSDNLRGYEVFDAESARLLFFDDSGPWSYPGAEISFGGHPRRIFKLLPLKDSLYIASGDFSEYRYALFLNNVFIDSVQGYPSNTELDKIQFLRPLVYQSHFTRQPGGVHFVSTVSNARILDFYTVRNDSVRLISSYNFGGPKVADMSGGAMVSVATLPDNIYGFISLSATTKYIYALYSGTSREQSGDDALLSQKIMVFSWNGDPVKIINLDHPVRNIGVSHDDGIIYGFGGRFGISLFQFSINPD